MPDLKLLILEDYEPDARLIEVALRRAGVSFASIVAGGREEFLRGLTHFEPDAVLSDYSFPQFNGLEALRMVREAGLDIPFILITGSQTEETVAECFKYGADDYLLKSSLTRLPAALANALHRRRAERDRTRAIRRLRDRERRLAEAQSLAHLGSWELGLGNLEDLNANQLWWSDETYRIFGHEPGAFAASNQAFFAAIPEPDHQAIQDAVAHAIYSGAPYEVEHRVIRPDGTERLVREQGGVERDSTGRPVRMLGTILDITDLRRAETRIRESESRLTAIVTSAMDAIVSVDQNHSVVLFNHAAEQLFGCLEPEALAHPLERFIAPRSRGRVRDQVAELLRNGAENRLIGGSEDLRGLRCDGEEFPMEASLSQASSGDGKTVTVIIRDITERRRAEADLRRSREELRALARGLQEVREDERERMAREVHDELGQVLTALKIDLTWVKNRLGPSQAPVSERLLAMMRLTDGAVDTVRRIASKLRPGVLDDLGLVAAIEWVVEDFGRRTGLPVATILPTEPPRVDREIGTALFRILQESLTNVARHAQAHQVRVHLWNEGDELFLEVRDDGRGLLTNAGQPKRRSLGVLGMRERAGALGGDLTVTGAPGMGTTVRARVPLRSHK